MSDISVEYSRSIDPHSCAVIGRNSGYLVERGAAVMLMQVSTAGVR